jgi:hypothetical protein
MRKKKDKLKCIEFDHQYHFKEWDWLFTYDIIRIGYDRLIINRFNITLLGLIISFRWRIKGRM